MRVLVAAALVLGGAVAVPTTQAAQGCAGVHHHGSVDVIDLPAALDGPSRYAANAPKASPDIQVATAQWTANHAGELSAEYPLLSVDPTNPSLMAAVDAGRTMVYTTSDGGCSWHLTLDGGQLLNGTTPQSRLSVRDVQYAGNKGRVVAVLCPSGPAAIGTSLQGSFNGQSAAAIVGLSDDAGKTWRMSSPAASSTVPWPGCSYPHLAISPKDMNRIYAWSGTSLVVSRDAGRSWSSVTVPHNVLPSYTDVGFGIDPSASDTVWAPSSYGPPVGDKKSYITAARSRDGGKTWKDTVFGDKLADPNASPWTVRMALGSDRPASARTVGIWAASALYLSRNGGSTWSLVNPTDSNEFDAVVVGRGRDAAMYAVVGQPHVAIVEEGIDRYDGYCNWIQQGFGVYQLAGKRWVSRGTLPVAANTRTWSWEPTKYGANGTAVVGLALTSTGGKGDNCSWWHATAVRWHTS